MSMRRNLPPTMNAGITIENNVLGLSNGYTCAFSALDNQPVACRRVSNQVDLGHENYTLPDECPSHTIDADYTLPDEAEIEVDYLIPDESVPIDTPMPSKHHIGQRTSKYSKMGSDVDILLKLGKIISYQFEWKDESTGLKSFKFNETNSRGRDNRQLTLLNVYIGDHMYVGDDVPGLLHMISSTESFLDRQVGKMQRFFSGKPQEKDFRKMFTAQRKLLLKALENVVEGETMRQRLEKAFDLMIREKQDDNIQYEEMSLYHSTLHALFFNRSTWKAMKDLTTKYMAINFLIEKKGGDVNGFRTIKLAPTAENNLYEIYVADIKTINLYNKQKATDINRIRPVHEKEISYNLKHTLGVIWGVYYMNSTTYNALVLQTDPERHKVRVPNKVYKMWEWNQKTQNDFYDRRMPHSDHHEDHDVVQPPESAKMRVWDDESHRGLRRHSLDPSGPTNGLLERMDDYCSCVEPGMSEDTETCTCNICECR
jgi:hypothetical protein